MIFLYYFTFLLDNVIELLRTGAKLDEKYRNNIVVKYFLFILLIDKPEKML